MTASVRPTKREQREGGELEEKESINVLKNEARK